MIRNKLNSCSSLIFFFCFLTGQIYGQQTQGFYAELLGSAFGYSVNYDTRFQAYDDTGLGFRIGLFYVKDRNDHILGFPAHLNYIFGKGRSKLELGAGLSVFIPEGPLTRDRAIYPSAAIMYRWQPPHAGFLFRIGLAPIFIPDERVSGESDALPPALFWFWPGVSFGYKF